MKKVAVATAMLLCNTMVHSAPVENFGSNIAPLQQAFLQKKLHILQVGDSHTAGDYFTDQIRKRLQADIGDGGLGFAYPIDLKAQRTARHGYQSFGVTTLNSKTQQQADYTLGGVSILPTQADSFVKLTSQFYQGDRQNAKIMVKGNIGQGLKISDMNGFRTLPLSEQGWQMLETNIQFPVQFQLEKGMVLGGYWLDRGYGGRVSAMGINGAKQNYWQRWQNLPISLRQSQADLVILAYGTNEAFAPDIDEQIGAVQYAITNIKQNLPNAVILIVNAPESLKSTQGTCGIRANHLDQVRQNLRQLAQQNATLYWDWQEAMGGECSMKTWIEQGLGAKDGVHFSKIGYQTAGDDLYNNLKLLLNNTTKNPYDNPQETILSQPSDPSSTMQLQPVSVKCDKQGHCLISNH